MAGFTVESHVYNEEEGATAAIPKYNRQSGSGLWSWRIEPNTAVGVNRSQDTIRPRVNNSSVSALEGRAAAAVGGSSNNILL